MLRVEGFIEQLACLGLGAIGLICLYLLVCLLTHWIDPS
jgi:hypothetical protein